MCEVSFATSAQSAGGSGEWRTECGRPLKTESQPSQTKALTNMPQNEFEGPNLITHTRVRIKEPFPEAMQREC